MNAQLQPAADTARIVELKALLRDLAFGADLMLQGPHAPSGWVLRYIQEVKRVAGAGAVI